MAFLKNQANSLQLCVPESCVVSLGAEYPTSVNNRYRYLLCGINSAYKSIPLPCCVVTFTSTSRRTMVLKFRSKGSALIEQRQHHMHMLCALPVLLLQGLLPLANISSLEVKLVAGSTSSNTLLAGPAEAISFCILYTKSRLSHNDWWFPLRFLLCHECILCCQACSIETFCELFVVQGVCSR